MPKTRFSITDDFALLLAFQIYGDNWPMVSHWIHHKNPKQCRERWLNHIDPNIDTASVTWTNDDILTLLLHYQIHGPKWAHISKQMPGFPQNSLKNKYFKVHRSLLKKCDDPIDTLLNFHYMIRESCCLHRE